METCLVPAEAYFNITQMFKREINEMKSFDDL